MLQNSECNVWNFQSLGLEFPLSKLLPELLTQDAYGSRRRPDRSRSMDGCWGRKFRFASVMVEPSSHVSPEAMAQDDRRIIEIMAHLLKDGNMGHAKDTTTMMTTRLKLGEEKNARKSGKERTSAFPFVKKRRKKNWACHSCLIFHLGFSCIKSTDPCRNGGRNGRRRKTWRSAGKVSQAQLRFSAQKKLLSTIDEQLLPPGVRSSDEESDLPARLQGVCGR